MAFHRLPFNFRQQAVVTVGWHIAAIRQILGWAADRGYWAECPRFYTLFKFKKRGIMNLEERSRIAGVHDIYTLEQLNTSYHSALCNDKDKGMIACALNFAFSSGESSDFLVREIDFTKNTVTRVRNKTGVVTSWPMFKTTRDLLLKLTKGKKGTARVFTRPDGKPLICFGEGTRVDMVAPTWRLLCRRAGVENKHYKSLRKLSAQLVRNASDKGTAEYHLAHAVNDVSAHYHHDDGQHLVAALAKVEAQIQAEVFTAKPVEGAKVKAA